MAGYNLNEFFGNSEAKPAQPELGFDANTGSLFNKKINPTSGTVPYIVKPENWFTAKPYGFRLTMRNGTPFTMFLPISPSNLSISTGFATNVISTLYGTVEEHSPVRYYDIVIEGTTGMMPKFVLVDDNLPRPGRPSFPISQGLSNIAGGFFTKTLSLIDQANNKASELISGVPKPGTGVHIDQTGYLAFHNLYRFLLKYKEDAAGLDGSTQERKQHPLTFFNYKDNNQYDVVVRNFTLKRTAENPMLYYYQITLRGYNLSTASDKVQAVDQTAERLAEFGLNGVDPSSLLDKIKSTTDNVKGVLGPLGAGINVLGR